MISFKSTDYFILSANTKIIKGKYRSLIIDYQRNDFFLIPNEFQSLLKIIDRALIKGIQKKIGKQSLDAYFDFLNFILENEIGFITSDIEKFPKISSKINDETILKDTIIEINENNYNINTFKEVILQIDKLYCTDLQIRFLSEFNPSFVIKVLDYIKHSNITYLEVHLSSYKNYNLNLLSELIEKYPSLSHIFIYGASTSEVIECSIKKENYYPLQIGNIYITETNFDSGNCCGIITQENLDFTNLKTYNELKKFNGCLYKKITIDTSGNIKNCPSMKFNYGNIKNISIKGVIQKTSFKKIEKINKDSILVCKDCEFRYSCTDCRAFIEDPDNIYSKPLKCGYNLESGKWEDWSKNILNKKTIKYYNNL